MLFIKEWTSKNGKQCKAIFARIDCTEYFICFCR